MFLIKRENHKFIEFSTVDFIFLRNIETFYGKELYIFTGHYILCFFLTKYTFMDIANCWISSYFIHCAL